MTFADSGEDRNEGTADNPDNVDVRENEIVLSIADTADPQDWIPEELVIKLENHPNLSTSEVTVRDFTDTFTVTITDRDTQPKFKFTPPSIQLAQGNMQEVTVGAGTGAGGAGPLSSGISTKLGTLDGGGGRGTSRDRILLSVEPAGAVGSGGLVDIVVVDSTANPPTTEALVADGQGRYEIGTISQAVSTTDPIKLRVTAKDVSGFRDETISLMLMDGRVERRMAADGGAVAEADPATVTILSGEETPTVTFSTDAVSIDEGESKSVHILADTDQGDQVGSVAVSVRGEAQLSLEQNGSPISGGVVSFGESANAELTIRAVSDAALDTGEEKTATVTITDASGANIGDQRTLTVTVVGSTAVPVLPLVGQLLLALLLTAGGARLYRRRQQ